MNEFVMIVSYEGVLIKALKHASKKELLAIAIGAILNMNLPTIERCAKIPFKRIKFKFSY